jgi:hypothetical protein
MSFNLLMAFRQRRLVRAGVGLLVLAAAVFALYKLAHVPRPVELATTGQFSPATIKLGEQELIIEGAMVNPEEGLLFSCDSGTNGIVQVDFRRARLDEQTIELLDSLKVKLPAEMTQINYRASDPRSSSKGLEPCSTRVELRVASQPPAEIRISQLGEVGANLRRQLQITASAELVSNLLTQSQGDSDLAPGCEKLLKVDDVSHRTSLDLTTHVAENSAIQFTFFPLASDSTPWGDARGSLPLDLGGPTKLNPNDAPPFQARAVSIRSLGSGATTNAPPVLSIRSEDGGPLLTISSLKIFSDQVQVNVAGKGSLAINGIAQTTNFLKFLQENPIASALLIAANAALLGWVARLVFKRPQTSRSLKDD